MTRPTLATVAPRTWSTAKGAGRYVLRGRPLRPGVVLSDTACFGDDVWPLTPALLQEHQNALSLDFTTLPVSMRAVAKELFDAMLSGDLPPGERRPGIATIRSTFSQLKSSSPGCRSAHTQSAQCWPTSPKRTWPTTHVI